MDDETTPDRPPTFTLPDWGTEGAPTLPPGMPEDDPREPEVRIVRPAEDGSDPSTGSAPIRGVGVVVGAGERTIGDEGLAAASEQAAIEAIEQAGARATELGARGIESVRITLTTRQGVVAALAYGTAIGAPASEGSAEDR